MNVITIDGPSGTGKGTLCCKLAEYLGWNLLDSGAIYRVLAFAARLHNIPLNATIDLVNLALGLTLKFDGSRIYLDSLEISQQIRTENCAKDASIIATIPEVRQALLELQRSFAKIPGLVADGRDLGTVVFPNAKIKFYLDATIEERANRRYLQLKKQGNNVSLAEVVDELSKRDARDKNRSHAPLIADHSAVYIDTTELSVNEVFEKLLEVVRLGGI